MKLYYDPLTVNCKKVVAGFGLLGAEFEKSHVDYFGGGHKAPEYVKINPNASLPALVDGDFTLWESNAILQYVADQKEAFDYYPRDPKVRADIHRWQLWEAAHWFPSCYVFLVENVVKPLLKAEPDKATIEKETPNWHRLANILDARLADQRWLCGDKVTIADISVAAPMHLHPYQKLPLAAHPNLRRWMTEDVEQLPSWKATDVAKMLGWA
ncbi:MAG TPA: glutathione S-transferase family protein [Burkholderiales bacterium]|nr:glutathione S-transferase family protein [Burkholderiales bacterium]